MSKNILGGHMILLRVSGRRLTTSFPRSLLQFPVLPPEIPQEEKVFHHQYRGDQAGAHQWQQ